MPVIPYNETELASLLTEIRRPYQRIASKTTGMGRDALWDHWRDVRHRRARPSLPEGIEIENTDVLYRDPLPEFVINRIKQRLGANAVTLALHLREEAGIEMQRRGERLEDWFRGCLEELDPNGRVDERFREHQAADGLAIAELELLPGYLPPSRGNASDAEYDRMLASSRRDFQFPIRMNAPDPRSLYWIAENEELKIMVKVVNVPLIDIQNKWTTVEGFRLVYDESVKGLDMAPVFDGQLPPAPTAAEYGMMARLVVISDDRHIYHCVYPQTLTRGLGSFDDSPGAKVNLTLLATYDNHFGRPPYFLAPARSTSDPDPAYRYLPLALEVLDTAEYVNQWRTMRMIKGRMDALKPWTYRPALPRGDESTAPKHLPNLLRPGILEHDGTFGELPTSEVLDFDKFDSVITQLHNSFNLSIMGAVQSGLVGRSTPAWSINQFNEEQVSILREALNSRATMYREILLAVGQCMRTKYAKDGPVYVRSNSVSRKDPRLGKVDLQVGLKADDFEIPFRLQVNIEALTQSQRAADTEYWRRRLQEGSISKETYMERIGTEDRLAEMARMDQEAVDADMVPAGRALGKLMALNSLRQVYGPVVDQLFLGAAPTPQTAPQIAEGQADGPTFDNEAAPRSPGMGMPISGPNLEDRLPNRMAEPSMNGNSYG